MGFIEEVCAFGENVRQNGRRGEMTGDTASAICVAFILSHKAAGSESMRTDIAKALMELCLTQTQFSELWTKTAEIILMDSVTVGL